MTDKMDLRRLAPRFGSSDRAFEELCCQLAYSNVGSSAGFIRVRGDGGDGGDGGVECLWRGPGGEVHGWQAKYIFDLGDAVAKARASPRKARENHPTLSRYVVCFPFDLSGSRGRSGKSQLERFQVFRGEVETEANAQRTSSSSSRPRAASRPTTPATSMSTRQRRVISVPVWDTSLAAIILCRQAVSTFTSTPVIRASAPWSSWPPSGVRRWAPRASTRQYLQSAGTCGRGPLRSAFTAWMSLVASSSASTAIRSWYSMWAGAFFSK